MKWISVNHESEIPTDKTIIVEDCNGWIGQAYFNEKDWVLETFKASKNDIYFDTIVRYLILPEPPKE